MQKYGNSSDGQELFGHGFNFLDKTGFLIASKESPPERRSGGRACPNDFSQAGIH